MAVLTLLDLITLQRNDSVTGLVEDVTTYAPEFSVFEAVPRSGHFYEVVRRTGLPSVGFRKVNAGVTPSKSAYKKELKEMYLLDGLINVDEAVMKADDQSTGSVWMHESQGALRQALITLGAQTFYGTGTGGSTDGFPGIRSQLSGSVGAGATSNSTSAYLCWMDRSQGVRFDVGENGSVSVTPPMRQQLPDPNDSTKFLFYWVANINCWVGLNVISSKGTWAVTGIDGTIGSNVLTNPWSDAVAAALISNIPTARRFNLRWFANRLAVYTLQRTRQAINLAGGYALQSASGTGSPAWSMQPEMCNGYPITMTDSILNTESN